MLLAFFVWLRNESGELINIQAREAPIACHAATAFLRSHRWVHRPCRSGKTKSTSHALLWSSSTAICPTKPSATSSNCAASGRYRVSDAAFEVNRRWMSLAMQKADTYCFRSPEPYKIGTLFLKTCHARFRIYDGIILGTNLFQCRLSLVLC